MNVLEIKVAGEVVGYYPMMPGSKVSDCVESFMDGYSGKKVVESRIMSADEFVKTLPFGEGFQWTEGIEF